MTQGRALKAHDENENNNKDDVEDENPNQVRSSIRQSEHSKVEQDDGETSEEAAEAVEKHEGEGEC